MPTRVIILPCNRNGKETFFDESYLRYFSISLVRNPVDLACRLDHNLTPEEIAFQRSQYDEWISSMETN